MRPVQEFLGEEALQALYERLRSDLPGGSTDGVTEGVWEPSAPDEHCGVFQMEAESAHYTRTGNVVLLTARIRISNPQSSRMSDTVRIQGLPFKVAQGRHYTGSASLGVDDMYMNTGVGTMSSAVSAHEDTLTLDSIDYRNTTSIVEMMGEVYLNISVIYVAEAD